jgi:uncharacterized protein (DUF58 family)
MNGASLRRNAFLLVLLTVALAVVGDWSEDALLAVSWRIPAALLLLGLAYESWLVARAALKTTLESAPKLFLGRAAQVNIVCRHALRRSLLIELAPSAPDYFEVDGGPVSLNIKAQEGAILAVRVTPTRLGKYSWPDLAIRATGPLGLAWWPRRLPCSQEIQVLPDIFRNAGEVAGAAESGAQSGFAIGAGIEILRLRDYRSGDSPRAVDWKATARAGRLISRDFAPDDGLQIVIVVDAGRSSALRAGALDRFGHYVNIAARLAQFAAERDDLVGLIIYADRPLAALAPARGVAAVTRVRQMLAAAKVERTESNPLYAATKVRSLVRHRSLVVLLTDIDDASVQSQLAQAARFLLPKHLPFIAGLSSAAAESMAHASAHEWLDPYRSLAAQEYTLGLQRKVAALNALGAPALVARPEHLEHAVFAAYTNFRRRRRA